MYRTVELFTVGPIPLVEAGFDLAESIEIKYLPHRERFLCTQIDARAQDIAFWTSTFVTARNFVETSPPEDVITISSFKGMMRKATGKLEALGYDVSTL